MNWLVLHFQSFICMTKINRVECRSQYMFPNTDSRDRAVFELDPEKYITDGIHPLTP